MKEFYQKRMGQFGRPQNKYYQNQPTKQRTLERSNIEINYTRKS